jgi:hypothetical protein
MMVADIHRREVAHVAVVVQEPAMLIMLLMVVALATGVVLLVASRGGVERRPYGYPYDRPRYARRPRVYALEEPDDGTGLGCTVLPFVLGAAVALVAVIMLLQ